MSQTFTVACVQNCAGAEIEPNLQETAELTAQAARDGADLICLPEYFSSCEIRDNLLLGRPFPEDEHPALPLFKGLARDHGASILLGSLAIGDRGRKVRQHQFSHQCRRCHRRPLPKDPPVRRQSAERGNLRRVRHRCARRRSGAGAHTLGPPWPFDLL